MVLHFLLLADSFEQEEAIRQFLAVKDVVGRDPLLQLLLVVSSASLLYVVKVMEEVILAVMSVGVKEIVGKGMKSLSLLRIVEAIERAERAVERTVEKTVERIGHD